MATKTNIKLFQREGTTAEITATAYERMLHYNTDLSSLGYYTSGLGELKYALTHDGDIYYSGGKIGMGGVTTPQSTLAVGGPGLTTYSIYGEIALGIGVYGKTAGLSSYGVRGDGNGSGGRGVFGSSIASDGYGVYAENNAGVALYCDDIGYFNDNVSIKGTENPQSLLSIQTSGDSSWPVYLSGADADDGVIYSRCGGTSDTTIYARADGNGSYGLYGYATGFSAWAVYGVADGPDGVGVYGRGDEFGGYFQNTISSGGSTIFSYCIGNNASGLYVSTSGTACSGVNVQATGIASYGVYSVGTAQDAVAVYAHSIGNDGIGVYCTGEEIGMVVRNTKSGTSLGLDVYASGSISVGAKFQTSGTDCNSMIAQANGAYGIAGAFVADVNEGVAISARSTTDTTDGRAGRFFGNVLVTSGSMIINRANNTWSPADATDNALHLIGDDGYAGGSSYSVDSVLAVENNSNCYVQVISNTTSYGGIMFGTQTAGFIHGIRAYHDRYQLELITGVQPKVIITSGGMVGFGNTWASNSPSGALHIHANAGGTDKGYVLLDTLSSEPDEVPSNTLAVYVSGGELVLKDSAGNRYTLDRTSA